MYQFFLKRAIDFLIALIGLILLAPVFIIVMVLLYFANQGKPFFVQTRPGLNEKMFNIIKFKTMNDKKDEKGNYLPDSERLTPVGSFIRQTSLDELPQLINVLKGDMALIGPRPLLPQYLSLYNESQKRRHNIRPGITGWAQVNGRNAISWTKKFELDIWYIDHLSFATDCKVVILTLKKVLKKEGINQVGQATIEAFNGSN
ncbi:MULTISPECIES: sugar transferase [Chryseobacterium]|jgi:lipopolysaccharide/colanic/teichoic acid biosynthesis glycosyltransferase|uniref:Lipopolysaccharide/colanic/teichoic acid biosynthesis glycosyltransferase n=1 Tax=Chryseobacterium rhizosphaerae TaxID=395937 RepID=A0AAE3YD60_9FLAO|nr:MULTISPECIES: sugar transferase [Chryseobacterium]MBL3546570.1 sugar transferase [Chryseobacterium sp. KMC2]MDC8099708.1 sugar transferase [Chryseobacterium rhizosphaerae]MDR6528612.1 lipopolysaccharide/colanic/teichoic acid biosynthesis glycosyltransferase [Chryseobacterium rhizosphaerae]MDR6547368.1 lipopolysaccharide/colanic/teichoic acid biosynthesis glycosyltransferase [Chryseobacterium rhizosphaerae]SMC99447.1 Sugar transferase involved in LPS biosynthesis (colanic, teichoic acid) [Ch